MKIEKVTVGAKLSKNYNTMNVEFVAEIEEGDNVAEVVQKLQLKAREEASKPLQ